MVVEPVVFIKLAAVCPQYGVTRAKHLYIWDFLVCTAYMRVMKVLHNNRKVFTRQPVRSGVLGRSIRVNRPRYGFVVAADCGSGG